MGHASAQEIDALGIIAALRLAGTRAWLDILAAGVSPDVVLLDGSHNWLSPAGQLSLFDEAVPESGCDAPVHTKVKADMQCLSVAAASVIAKVERDQQMRGTARRVPGVWLGHQQGLRHRDAPGRAARRRAHALPPGELEPPRRGTAGARHWDGSSACRARPLRRRRRPGWCKMEA